jgi:hypothetical protein
MVEAQLHRLLRCAYIRPWHRQQLSRTRPGHVARLVDIRDNLVAGAQDNLAQFDAEQIRKSTVVN